MVFDGCQLLLLALQSVTGASPSAKQRELLLNIYNTLPEIDRADTISKVLDSCDAEAALTLCSVIPDVMHFGANNIERITHLVSNAVLQNKMSFHIIPDPFRPEYIARDYILSIVYLVLKDSMALTLYSGLFSPFLEQHVALMIDAPCLDSIHDSSSSIDLHLSEAATLAVRVLEPMHFILILAAWYWASRSSLLPPSVCNSLETICRQAFSTDLFDSVDPENVPINCDLLLDFLSTVLKNEGIGRVNGYLNHQVKECKYLELISSLLSLAGGFLSAMTKGQLIDSKSIGSIVCISAYIVGLGSSAAVKRIGLFLKVISPICGIDTAFSTALLMLLDSVESTSLHLVVPAFQRFGPQLLTYINNLNDTNLIPLDQSPVLLLMYNFLHRAMTLTPLPIRRFYLHVLPLIAVGFISTFKVSSALFSPLFMASSMLPAISGLQEQRFSRSDEARKRIAQERSRSLYIPQNGKDYIDGQYITAPYQLLKNCVFLSPDDNYQATPFEDRSIESIFPLTDAFISTVSSAIDETLDNIAVGYYALAKRYNDLCVGSPFAADNTVYRAVVLQMLLQSTFDGRNPAISLSNICTIMAASGGYVFPSVLFVTITCAVSVIEYCITGHKEGACDSSTLGIYAVPDTLSTNVLESFKRLYCSVLNVNRIHRPFFLTILFKLALSLSQLCNFMPSDIMAVFMCHTFQLTDLPQEPTILAEWIAQAERGKLSAIDLLVTLFLCSLCRRPVPTLNRPAVDVSDIDDSFYTLLSDMEHPSVVDLFKTLPDYVRNTINLLRNNPQCISTLKATINILRHGYKSREPSDAMLALHSNIWSVASPNTSFLSPLTAKQIPNPDHHCLVSALNSLSLEAISYRLCTTDDVSKLSVDTVRSFMNDWETFSGTHAASFFGMLNNICLVCVKAIQLSRCDKKISETWAEIVYEACEMVFQTVNNGISGTAKGIYFHLAAKVLFSEHIIEALWLLYTSKSACYSKLLLMVRRFFTGVYLFISLAPIYSCSIVTPLVSSLHVLIFNREDALLRCNFVETELLDMILCLALYIPYDGSYYEVEDASSIVVQTGLIRYYEQIDRSECISDTSFFADYRVRKSAIGLLQTLTCHLTPLEIILPLLVKNMEPSKEALDKRRKNLLKENPADIKRGKARIDVSKLPDCIFSDLYRSLFIPLIEPQKELSTLMSVSQLKQLTFLRILRMLASITYHNKPYNSQSSESIETTLSNVISMFSSRLSMVCWARNSREIWEQALVLLIISSSRPLVAIQEALPHLSPKKLFTDKFTRLQSHLIITCNTICIVVDEWMDRVLEKSDGSIHTNMLTSFPDYSTYQMHLRELVPYALSPVHGLRIISQAFFLRMWDKGRLLTEAMRANNVPGQSFINRALLSVSVSSSLLSIFKVSLESTDIVKKYGSLLDLLDPRTEALCMTSAAAYVDTYHPTPNISAVAGNVVTTLDEAAAEDTNYKKIIGHAMASLDLGPKGFAQLEEYTKHEAIWTESSGSITEPNEDNYQQKIHSIGKGEDNLLDQSSRLIVNASLLDKTTNLGGLARTAEVFGLESLTLGNASFALDPSFKAMSMTADMWLKIEEVRPCELIQWITEKRKDGYSVVCLEQSSKSVYLQNAKLPAKAILVLGNERNGCPEEILSLCDMTVEIQQIGNTRSLNVHVSCAIFVWEWACQHKFAITN